jgi:hypothetical protein
VVGHAGFDDVPVYVVVTAYVDEPGLGTAVDLVTRALRTVAVVWSGPT